MAKPRSVPVSVGRCSVVHWSLLAMVQPKMKNFDGLDDASSCTFFSSSNRQECYRFPTPSRHSNGMDGWSCQSSHPDWWVWRINPRSRQPDARDEPTGARLVHYRAVPSRELSQPTRAHLCATRRRLGRPATDDRRTPGGNYSGFPLRLGLIGVQARKNPRNATLLLFVTVWEGGDQSRGSWFAVGFAEGITSGWHNP